MTTDGKTQGGHTTPNATDISWMAKGYWDRYFSSRIYTPAKFLLIIAGIVLLIAILVAALISDLYDSTGAGPTGLGMLVVLSFVAVGALALGYVIRATRDRDEYIDSMVERWEKGESLLPDKESVQVFVNQKNRRI